MCFTQIKGGRGRKKKTLDPENTGCNRERRDVQDDGEGRCLGDSRPREHPEQTGAGGQRAPGRTSSRS